MIVTPYTVGAKCLIVNLNTDAGLFAHLQNRNWIEKRRSMLQILPRACLPHFDSSDMQA